jgi:membrane protease YdiL (CAAX protease family)
MVVLLFILLTVVLTKKQSDEEPGKTKRLQIKLLLQVSVILITILVTGYQSCMWHGVFKNVPIPIWSQLIGTFGQFGEKYLDPDIVGNGYVAVANPVQYFIMPFVLLILLGAKFHELGFKKGHRTWRVSAIWCFLPIIIIILYIFTGNLTISRLWKRLLGNLLQNGFGEEFLFRGALQTRLTKLVGSSWAIVIQSLIFGVWHLGVGFRETEGKGILAAIASSIICQGIAGLAFGFIFQRTHNLLGCTTFHVVSNSVFF